MDHDFDVLIIGSGFGGSVAAMRLTEKGYRVGVLEAGKRWSAETLPETSWNTRRFFWFPRLGMRGIQRISLLKNVMILSGSGVGGGSLVWANVSYRPHDAFYSDPQWGEVTDWESELAPFYDQAERMLGVEDNPTETNSDRVIKEVAEHFGVEDSFRPTPVAVYFGEKKVEVPDPYFGGEGPTRTGCRECGGCMVGCRYNAKNTLDRNYLYMAERHGTQVHPLNQVTDVAPMDGGGYVVSTERPGAWMNKRQRTFTAGQVVFAAGALGTSKLLLRLKESRLPDLSERLGFQFRTNSEAVLGARAKDRSIDYSEGVAITSSIHPEPHTHIEPVRYPVGSNSMGGRRRKATQVDEIHRSRPRQACAVAESPEYPPLVRAHGDPARDAKPGQQPSPVSQGRTVHHRPCHRQTGPDLSPDRQRGGSGGSCRHGRGSRKLAQ